MQKNYYKIMGIKKDASPEEIKAAYRKLARRYHPDLNPNDKEANKKFQELNEANEVLSDPEKRKKYDKSGRHWQDSLKNTQKTKAKKSSKVRAGTYKTYYDLDYGNIKVKIRVTDSYAFTSVTIDLYTL